MSAEGTSLTDLQRWAREQGIPLAPNALRALRAENIETAEQAAELPTAVLLSMPWVKENSVNAIRTWQKGRGIPITPDPEPLPGAGDEINAKPRRLMGVGPAHAVPYQTLVWPPQNEIERFAWETYVALLSPGEGAIARPGPLEAIRQAWAATEAWEREKRASKGRVKAEVEAERGNSEDDGKEMA